MLGEAVVVFALALAALGPRAALAAAEGADDSDARLRMSIESPADGAIIGDPGGMGFVSGQALALYGEFQTFDIMFVIDTSMSTSEASGADIDGDGVISEPRGDKFFSLFGWLPLGFTDDGDSVLAAEVAAVEQLLGQLDPRTTRVGLVAFAGDDDPLTPDAYVVVQMTSEFSKVQRGLRRIQDDGPRGRTNMVMALDLATVELLGTQSAYSEPREGARKVILFLTDGLPTLPYEGRRQDNVRSTLAKAQFAKRADIRIDSYAVGPEALRQPLSTVEMARITNGVFTPVTRPSDLRAVFEEVDFADIDALTVTNRTTGAVADPLIRNADGSFSALLSMREGENTIEVYARATDGTEGRRSVKVRYVEGAGVSELDPRLLSQRNRLLENRLRRLRDRVMEIQTERDEEARRALRLEIERERAKAQREADKLRKELDVEVVE